MRYVHACCAFLVTWVFVSHAQAVWLEVDLSSAANRAYIDPVAGDGKGWTSQGPEDSLTKMTRDPFAYGGLVYKIILPAEHPDKQVLVFDNKNDPTGLTEAEVPVNEGTGPIGHNLYLLHAAAWVTSGDTTPVGTVSVRTDTGKVVDFPIRAGTEVGDWKNPIDLPNATVVYQENHPSGPVGVYLTRLALPADSGRPVALSFHSTGNAQWIVLAATMTDHDPLANAAATWAPSADQGWKPVDLDNIDVQAGSALDFSAIFPPKPVGSDGFVIVNKKGQLAFEKEPDVSVRFLCCSMISEIPSDATDDEINAFADQVQRGGYNMLRPHYLDRWLRNGDPKDGGPLNPQSIDAWERLVAALKVRGVYLFLDITTLLPPVRLPMYYDPAAREIWKTTATAILTHVNPHTGLALKDDPIVAIGQLRNEAGLSYLAARKDPDTLKALPLLDVSFRAWLRKKYGTDDAFRAAWTPRPGDPPTSLKPADTLDTVGLPPISGRGADVNDMELFFVDTQRDLYQWMAGVVHGLGLRAPLTDFNNAYSLESDLTRDVLPLVDNHTYFDHPRFFKNPNDANTTEGAGNPLRNGIYYYFELPTTRQLGRPFTVSEWGQVFWNPYRYQAGITFPAYASLQGWQMLAQFTNPIRPARTGTPFPLVPAGAFRLFNDPSTRAGEYISAMIFRRGDLQQSPHNVELLLDPKTITSKLSLQDAPSIPISRVALVAALGTRIAPWPGAAPRADYHADLTLIPAGSQAIATQEGAQTLTPSPPKPNTPDEIFGKLRSTGILSPQNRSDVSKGLYESDTSQIFLDTKVGTIQIQNPMSQGGTLFPGDAGLQLPDFSAKLNGADGAVFAGSLTPQPLASSPHILLLIITDALNSHMRFTTAKQQVLVDLGMGPVLMRVAQADISLRNTAAGTPHLWALSASGTRREEIPLVEKDGAVSAHIDTAALHHGPTPYFEFIRSSP